MRLLFDREANENYDERRTKIVSCCASLTYVKNDSTPISLFKTAGGPGAENEYATGDAC